MIFKTISRFVFLLLFFMLNMPFLGRLVSTWPHMWIDGKGVIVQHLQRPAWTAVHRIIQPGIHILHMVPCCLALSTTYSPYSRTSHARLSSLMYNHLGVYMSVTDHPTKTACVHFMVPRFWCPFFKSLHSTSNATHKVNKYILIRGAHPRETVPKSSINPLSFAKKLC